MLLPDVEPLRCIEIRFGLRTLLLVPDSRALREPTDQQQQQQGQQQQGQQQPTNDDSSRPRESDQWVSESRGRWHPDVEAVFQLCAEALLLEVVEDALGIDAGTLEENLRLEHGRLLLVDCSNQGGHVAACLGPGAERLSGLLDTFLAVGDVHLKPISCFLLASNCGPVGWI
mmetsp:Transcript_13506/g.24284  ORF Transcript_13506/g.24284 Transcript_13506/m.24284 type:complete len:172 (+) Transcript_13506:71-586(+)